MEKKDISELHLSIIIPVFNVEKYLEKCVESVINNNFINYEIILVNDGSTDNSGEICDQLKEKYKDIITVVHKENGGLSSARNSGIRKAKGKYLMFVDSDDLLNKIDFEKIFSKEVDIIQYKMVYYYENTDKYIHLKNIDEQCNQYGLKDYIKHQISSGTLSVSACDKIIKRELITKNKLFFKEGLLSEDINWSLELYLYSNSIVSYNDEIYIYRKQRKNSITNTTNKKTMESSIYIFDRWISYDYKTSEIKEIYMNYLAYLYTILLTNSNRKNTTPEQKKYIKDHKYILKYDLNYKVKLCNKVFRLVGIKLGSLVLKLYLTLKNKGVVKL